MNSFSDMATESNLKIPPKGVTSLAQMRMLIGLFEELHSKQRRALMEQARGLLTSFPAVVRKNRIKYISSFNIVEMCGLGSDEVRHSSILAWLLDENGNHAHGSMFLKAMAPIIGLELHGDTEDYTVTAEFPGFESITDIVIYKTGDFFISIENKINANEGLDQLNREYRDRERYADSLDIPAHRRIAVFLTPDGRKPTTGNPQKWCCLSYFQIATVFNSVSFKDPSQKLPLFIEDWVASINNRKI